MQKASEIVRASLDKGVLHSELGNLENPPGTDRNPRLSARHDPGGETTRKGAADLSALGKSRSTHRWQKCASGTFPDKRTGKPTRFYIWTPSDFLRDNSLSTDARFLLLVLRSFANNVTEPAYPSNQTLLDITGWGHNKLTNVLKDIRDKTETEFRQRKMKGRYDIREVYLPKWMFQDRLPHSGLR